MKKIKAKFKSLIYDFIYIPIYFKIVYLRDWKKIKRLFGKFEHLNHSDQKKYTLVFKNNARNVCGILVPEIVKTIKELDLKPNHVLMDGDNRLVITQIKEEFELNDAEILTTGIDGDYDFIWNFEENPPNDIPTNFDLIISQAMFEHLINPFKHFEDLSKLLKNGGYLIIHSHLPGYTYHRYPIDTVRFFPDWFEYSAIKIGLKVKRKFMRDFHLIYLFEK